LDSGVDVNSPSMRGHTVLYCAAGHGHAETVRVLLDHQVDIAAACVPDGKNILEWLAQYPDDPRLAEVARIIGAG
ncbi:MAG: ankyrin repeat domain-containing protein, partial [Planctomycetota bacterium]